MIQIKKRLFSAFVVISILINILPISALAEDNISEVVYQKSVIDEQQTNLMGGVSIPLNFDEETFKQWYEETYRDNIYFSLIDSLTEEEKDLLCRITFLEAGNQSEEGQRAVIEVILNRVLSNKFPNSVYEILSQENQFSTWKMRNKVKEENIEKIMLVLDIVHNEKAILSKEYLYFDGKQHSYATNYIQIDKHWFGTSR